jgi:hypothetical protein
MTEKKYVLVNRAVSNLNDDRVFDRGFVKQFFSFFKEYFNDNLLERKDTELKKIDEESETKQGLYFKKQIINTYINELGYDMRDYRQAVETNKKPISNSVKSAKNSCKTIVKQIDKLSKTIDEAIENPTFYEGLMLNEEIIPNWKESSETIKYINELYGNAEKEESDKFIIDCYIKIEKKIVLEYASRLRLLSQRIIVANNILNIVGKEIAELESVFKANEKAKAKPFDKRILIVKDLEKIFSYYTSFKPVIQRNKIHFPDKNNFTTFVNEFSEKFDMSIDMKTVEKWIK